MVALNIYWPASYISFVSYKFLYPKILSLYKSTHVGARTYIYEKLFIVIGETPFHAHVKIYETVLHKIAK